ncbi:rhodanese-like domain-containing protein [Sphingopyxis sp. MWB1]|uniref:rhodanese-like domain-containing protein n=1 Tax=Sphingopyxis sp. MWB1 TaxID=1537715 RepID=UPI00068ABA02|nr:rhodanese-like domain-containing protein [Sphingopyxis sp. MWB1]
MRRTPLLLACALIALPAAAQPGGETDAVSTPPQIDYAGFAALTQAVAPYRAERRLPFARFRQEVARPGALLLDARSRDAFAAGHIAGAVNLPLTDFTAARLAALIGPDVNRPIYIYCNNNFANDAEPVPMKRAQLSLNIQTFINLVGYGYPNVWELGEEIDFTDPAVAWVAP